MNAEQRRALEKEFQDILKITNPLVPATLDPNNPTAMSVPEVESELARRHAHTPGGQSCKDPARMSPRALQTLRRASQRALIISHKFLDAFICEFVCDVKALPGEV
jgi:hypothetical protein